MQHFRQVSLHNNTIIKKPNGKNKVPSFKIGDSEMLMHVRIYASGGRNPEKKVGVNIEYE